MELSIELDEIPSGVPLIAISVDEFKVDHKSDKQIYESMAQAKMAGRRLLRTTPALNFVDIFHHKRSFSEFTTEDSETIEKVIIIDL